MTTWENIMTDFRTIAQVNRVKTLIDSAIADIRNSELLDQHNSQVIEVALASLEGARDDLENLACELANE